MTFFECPICRSEYGACTGPTETNHRMLIRPPQLMTGPERVKRPRRTRLGREGYVGDRDGRVQHFDPERPHIVFVSGEEDEPNE